MNTFQGIDEPVIEFKNYAIGGKMITATVRVSEDVMDTKFNDEDARKAMRHQLVGMLASAMLEQKLCEINSYKNPMDFTTTIVARCYVAPDGEIKLLRTIDRD